MGKNVVVIASGVTERRAIPHLTSILQSEEISIVDVRIPGTSALTPERMRNIIRACWFEATGRRQPLSKFVALVDADHRDPEDTIKSYEQANEHLRDIAIPCIVTAVKWHLEAWFFGDAEGLRAFLGRDLGAVDSSNPDRIDNPKLHLKHLLPEPNTARVAEEIARCVDPGKISGRSLSFRRFEDALRNGVN